MAAYDTSHHKWAFCTNIATGTGTTTLLGGVAGKTMMVQSLVVVITVAAAQAFDIEDTGGAPVEVFKAPASLGAGVYPVDTGPLGIALTAGEGIEYVATAGVQLTISGFGYYKEA